MITEQQEEALESMDNNYYKPTIMGSEKSDLYDKIRPEDVIESMKYLLMGYEFSKQKGEWIFNSVYKNVAMSKLGAWQIATMLLAVSNKSTSISSLKDGDIRARTKAMVRTGEKMCLRNWREYGIRSADQYFFIKEIILSISFIMLKQPEGAGVRKFIQGVSSENRIIQEQPKKEGMLSGIFRR